MASRKKAMNALEMLLDECRAFVMANAGMIAPKTSGIATPIIAARLIAAAGSLEKLARMPSSKIQLLGAEKAFFSSVKEGGKIPKYGILFFHPEVQKAKGKGKAARKIANEIAKAARIDFYSGKN